MNDRNLSCFFVRELLALYIEERIDKARREQMTDHLKTCPECKKKFAKIKNSRAILLELSHTRPQASLIEYLKKEHNFWSDFFERVGWQRWPPTVKWAFELSAVALALVLTIHLFPWLNLAKRMNNIRTAQVAALNNNVNNDANTSVNVVTQATPHSETQAADDVSAQGDEEPAPRPKSAKAVAALVANGGDEGSEQASTKTVEDSQAAADENAAGPAGVKTGYVWRGTLKVEELTDELTEKVNRVISELGGVKAGQVELGWHRGRQRYYHFILPEENYEKLLSSLNGEGILTLNREVHPRVIKEGHMRIIMTLEEDQ